eukprot:TRINITY_DN8276_c0_g1_i1.p1 TRINITY_DN8276_c0_g1~~TRINITY_DN8276_c0_g1_i1.p1  ORF type:complete len:485 (+),score=126.02 TRINITY_DN8276_c0_g1_i1:477-1931(+)
MKTKTFEILQKTPHESVGRSERKDGRGNNSVIGKMSFLLWLAVLALAAANSPPKHVHLSLSDKSTEMHVVWVTDNSAGTEVQFAPHAAMKQSHRVVKGLQSELQFGTGFLHKATLDGLVPETKYTYRVGSDASGWSEDFSFRTRPDSSSDQEFTVLTYGDMGVAGSQPGVAEFQTAVLQESLIARSDLVLHAGDLAYAFKNLTKINNFFSTMQPLAASVPYMVVPGNRDDKEVFEERFTMPASGSAEPNFYWSVDYLWVHVIGISTSLSTFTADSEQHRWFLADLKRAAARVADPADPVNWIVLLGHTPLYSSSNGHTGGNKPLKALIEQAVWQYGVDLAIFGDDHGYERTLPVFNDEPVDKFSTKNRAQVFDSPNRTTHFVLGTGGVGLDGWQSETPPKWSAARALTYGYMTLTFSREAVKGQFVSTSGEVLDQFVILKPGRSSALNATLVCGVLLCFAVGCFYYRRTRRSGAGEGNFCSKSA